MHASKHTDCPRRAGLHACQTEEEATCNATVSTESHKRRRVSRIRAAPQTRQRRSANHAPAAASQTASAGVPRG
eukprot:5298503-Alexandrium_andersonii.AAC.1